MGFYGVTIVYRRICNGFPGFWLGAFVGTGLTDIVQFHSPWMKPCQSVDWFLKVNSNFVVDTQQDKSCKYRLWHGVRKYVLVVVVQNLTDFRKTMETGVDPRL